MKPFLVLFLLAAVILGGSFAWLAAADVPLPQTQVHKTLPNDQFLNKKD